MSNEAPMPYEDVTKAQEVLLDKFNVKKADFERRVDAMERAYKAVNDSLIHSNRKNAYRDIEAFDTAEY